MERYLIIIEEFNGTYSAMAPDVPGCVAAADTRANVERAMAEALEFHLEGLQRAGEPIPKPTATGSYVDVAVAA